MRLTAMLLIGTCALVLIVLALLGLVLWVDILRPLLAAIGG
jgi:hypothetical protein